MAVLEAAGLGVRFGAVEALSGLSLSVDIGQLVGLIGPNGAGKTTALDALTGFLPAKGSVHFQGRDLTGASATQRARSGLARTWQSVELFEGLTVAENLLVVAERGGVRQLLRDVFGRARSIRETVSEALGAVEIEHLAERLPDQLSHGERKLVGVARSLAARPRLLLLDEPAAGLDSAESQVLGGRLRGLADGGLPLVLVEHDMGMVLNICDYIYVIDQGRLIAEGPPAQIQRDPAVIASYLGSADTAPSLGTEPALVAPSTGLPAR
jgi:branched-chain amino acid transport system ATP-binding protein